MSVKKEEENKNAPQTEEEQKTLSEEVTPEITSEEPPQPQAEAAEALKAQMDELNDRLMRTLAEYDNYRKRSQRERLDIYPDAVAATVTKFLPVLDNFERTMKSDCTDVEFKKGVEMILSSFQECLKGLNVEEIEALGKEFDPQYENAVMHTEDETVGANMVVQVLQKGYKIGEKVLRHAMVQVAN